MTDDEMIDFDSCVGEISLVSENVSIYVTEDEGEHDDKLVALLEVIFQMLYTNQRNEQTKTKRIDIHTRILQNDSAYFQLFCECLKRNMGHEIYFINRFPIQSVIARMDDWTEIEY